jgi:dTDP-4-amino-4,6-dideoxygalactose transaminase
MDKKRLPALLGGQPLSKKPLHIVRPKFPELEKVAERFSEALKSGMVTNHGIYVQEFEKALSEYVGVPAVVCNNGQSALMMMLRAAGIDSGEVIVPSYTFAATAHAVCWCGATPVFTDIEPNGSLCLDPEDVEKRITSKTKAILGVDVYGIACDYQALKEIGARHGIKVLYDSAPAFGSKVDGSRIGGFGDAQSFSFHASKTFTTMEGGCITTCDEEIRSRMIALRNFGQTDGSDCLEPGFNAKMLEICALIGLENLEKIDEVIAQRCRMAVCFRQGLSEIEGLLFAEVPSGQEPSWFCFPVIVDPNITGLDRNILAQAMEAENLYVRKYFDIPCHHMSAYRESNRDLCLERTEWVAENVISLPLYDDMTEEECQFFVDGISSIICHAEAFKQKSLEGD